MSTCDSHLGSNNTNSNGKIEEDATQKQRGWKRFAPSKIPFKLSRAADVMRYWTSPYVRSKVMQSFVPSVDSSMTMFVLIMKLLFLTLFQSLPCIVINHISLKRLDKQEIQSRACVNRSLIYSRLSTTYTTAIALYYGQNQCSPKSMREEYADL